MNDDRHCADHSGIEIRCQEIYEMHKDIKMLNQTVAEDLGTINKLVAVHDEQLKNLKYAAAVIGVAVVGVLVKLAFDTIMEVN